MNGFPVSDWEDALSAVASTGELRLLEQVAVTDQVLNETLSDGQPLRSRLALRRRQIAKVEAEQPPDPRPDTTVVGRALDQASIDLAVSAKRRLAAIRDARDAGWSNEAIGIRLGITEAAVRGLVRRNG